MDLTLQTYENGYLPTWCAGCGNYGIWAAFKKALIQLGLSPDQFVCVYDIGCNGNGSNWFKSYGFHSLHGRALPAATGIKLARHDLPVFVFAGDGGALGEGGNHFLHACRSNLDIVYVIHDNQLYSLTTGQTSPTTEVGVATKSAPQGAAETPLRPLQLAISAGATFVARSYADDMAGLTQLLVDGINHRGMAVIDVLQPCVTFNLHNTRDWYKEHTVKLTPEYHDPSDRAKALTLAGEWNGKIPLGLLYREDRRTYADELAQLAGKPLTQLVTPQDVTQLLEEFR